ncbi:hypothetical protein RI543_001171 [Arxiozyma heterogenica]|uniref:Uncharacterized protein n=1 Tax=Arxiozyma heterogenica TaxID=278026 RepID=A0AAN7WNJ5_9SACH|nr:hypothetical protein RI543_001171 [Kazachstania heterogenica]
MRIIRCIAKTVILFLVLLSTLRYSCDNGYITKQLDCLCHYSRIGVLDQILTNKYPVGYKLTIRDPLEPKINWVYDHITSGCSYLSEKVNENESLRNLVLYYKERLSIVINNITLRGKFLWNHLYNSYDFDSKLVKVSKFRDSIQNSLMNYFDCGKNHLVSIVKLFNEKYATITAPSSSFPSIFSSLFIFTENTSSLTVASKAIRSDFDDKTETFTITSTVYKTMTGTYDLSPSEAGTACIIGNSTINEININDFSNSIVLNEQDIIQKQFDDWTNSIENKVQSIITVFDKLVNETIVDITNQTETSLKPKFHSFMNETKTYFKNITSATNDIDCKMEIDPVTGKAIYFDKDGVTQLEKYIDRQYVRDIFHDLNQMNNQFVDMVHNELKLLMDQVNGKVELLRKDYIDIYEEWANVMVNEWSKRLVYADIVNANTNDVDNDMSNNDNWRNFLRVKEQIIQSRDELLNHKVILDYVETFIRRVEFSLKMLLKENGEYTYILRSKANLAFQKREKEEAELKRQLEEELLKQKEEGELKLQLQQQKRHNENIRQFHVDKQAQQQQHNHVEVKGKKNHKQEIIDIQEDVEVFEDSQGEVTEQE